MMLKIRRPIGPSACLDTPVSSLSLTRRQILAGGAACAAILGAGRGWANGTALGQPQGMRFEDLITHARVAAQQPYAPTPVPAPDLIEQIDYNAHWKIRFREDLSLFPGAADAPVQMFYPGRYFPDPVRIYIRDGRRQRPRSTV